MTPRRRRPPAATWRFRGGLGRVDHRFALAAVDRDDGGSLLSASQVKKICQEQKGRRCWVDPGVGDKHDSVTARDIVEGDGLEEELGTMVVLDDDGPWHTMLVHLPVKLHRELGLPLPSPKASTSSFTWTTHGPLQLHNILDKH
uniref:Uncharacterized protein n=1 Tax=Oryza punctata TaxID=4537 RepID=A0A0E0KHV1_ORYPU